MRHVVISCIFRPHIVEQGTECWCHPHYHDDHVCHRQIEVRPDSQPRMARFSEQRHL